MKKRLIALTLSLVAASFVSAASVASSEESSGLGFIGEIFSNVNQGTDSLEETEYQESFDQPTEREGTGFSTPQEAAAEYIEGFCEMDYEKMISACAVEIYVDRFDAVKYMEKYKVSNPYWDGESGFLPYKDSISTTINYNIRRDQLNDIIKYRYLNVYAPDIDLEQPIMLKEGESAAQLIQERFGDGRIPEITFRGEFLSPILFRDQYYSYPYLDGEYDYAEVFGMTRCTCLLPILYFDGVPGIMMLGTCCYDGRWYVTNRATISAFFEGLASYSGMLVPMSETFTDEELSEYKNYMSELLSNETLMSASAKVDEAILNMDLQQLSLVGETDKDSAENMIESTWTSVLTPQELDLIKEYKGSLFYG